MTLEEIRERVLSHMEECGIVPSEEIAKLYVKKIRDLWNYECRKAATLPGGPEDFKITYLPTMPSDPSTDGFEAGSSSPEPEHG